MHSFLYTISCADYLLKKYRIPQYFFYMILGILSRALSHPAHRTRDFADAAQLIGVQSKAASGPSVATRHGPTHSRNKIPKMNYLDLGRSAMDSTV
jgi:hypothetical protein